MCADANTALAIAVVPYAVEAKMEDSLYQLMAGACKSLAESNCSLVGGHTCEGTEFALGFAVNGVVEEKKVLCKGGINTGDKLILTKGLGTGTILAADMRVKAKAAWMEATLQSMIKSNR